ncbi:multi-sensor signal transduction histidine kinase [Haloterrigena turkmenica DSM 5511]|uniref:histidine kinase n=1 Tax=Haloterrigena turkmenica (strain ATCC 51198 / DSM 5511 / JCM 9101 / NCIMB 13204 / VKM B-1734 / 4k) TaxID=543526 RepID=D2RU87_HALTV|nr:ATP-binding protein [Haloterrigena turkmenica]ADB59156.1 multi-sensor signal transduction histidine kinase [Haloterrigena turkmenica DSM 5511]
MPDRSEPSVTGGDDAATAAYERITDAVFALDSEWRFTFCNEQAERLLRRSETELLGTVVWEAFPDAFSPFRATYERAMDTQEPVAFGARSEPLDDWIEGRAYPSENGLTVTVRVDTEHVRRRERLDRRRTALQNAYEVIADPDRSLDEQLQSLLGVVRETIGTEYGTLSCVHEDADEYIFEAVDAPPDADLEAGDTTALEATNCERVVSSERTLVLQDVDADAPELADRAGNAEWGISCYLGTPVVVDGDVYGTFCFYDMEARTEAFSDWEVTFVELLGNWVSAELERREYEADLETSNERLEQFAYAASHDLKEPLRMVESYLSLIERRYGDVLDEDGREFIDYAVDGAERMKAMINGLLAYSRVETRGAPFEPVDLNAVFEDVRSDLELQLTETSAELSRESLPRVEGDPDQLQQVLQNLLSNALQYSGDEPPRVRVSAERRGDEWIVSVSDEGIGVDPDDADRIFDVFQRLHSHEEFDGTGIGLALCERIIERHDGEIWVESVPGEGATFRFTLPAATARES